MPDFTIITPVLNQVSHIETCIRSVLEQECNVQHIIMDGGSTDGTVDIIRKYENRISYWKSEPDEGQSHAINKGLILANGRFFNWLNADDRLTPHALKKVLQSAAENTEVIVGKCEHINENGDLIAIGKARIWPTLEATLGNYSMGQPSVFYRTSIVKELGGLNESLHYCMDMDLWFRYLTRFGQENITQISSILSKFLVHPASKSVDFGKEMRDEKYGVYKVLLSQFEQPDILTEFLSGFTIPDINPASYHQKLNRNILLANFCWHLMVASYENDEWENCRAYFDCIKKGDRLSASEKLTWRARLAKQQFLG